MTIECTFTCDWFHSYRDECLATPCLSVGNGCVTAGAPSGSSCAEWCCVKEPVRGLIFILPAIAGLFLTVVLARCAYAVYHRRQKNLQVKALRHASGEFTSSEDEAEVIPYPIEQPPVAAATKDRSSAPAPMEWNATPSTSHVRERTSASQAAAAQPVSKSVPSVYSSAQRAQKSVSHDGSISPTARDPAVAAGSHSRAVVREVKGRPHVGPHAPIRPAEESREPFADYRPPKTSPRANAADHDHYRIVGVVPLPAQNGVSSRPHAPTSHPVQHPLTQAHFDSATPRPRSALEIEAFVPRSEASSHLQNSSNGDFEQDSPAEATHWWQ